MCEGLILVWVSKGEKGDWVSREEGLCETVALVWVREENGRDGYM